MKDSEACFTPEQLIELGIEKPRLSWRARLMQRVGFTLRQAAVGALAGGVGVPVITSLVVEGTTRLVSALAQDPLTEDFFQFARVAPFYLSPLTAGYAALHMGMLAIVYGEKEE